MPFILFFMPFIITIFKPFKGCSFAVFSFALNGHKTQQLVRALAVIAFMYTYILRMRVGVRKVTLTSLSFPR